MEKGHAIYHLQQQPVFELQPPFTFRGVKERAIKYIPDFVYRDRETGDFVIEDVKGVRTAAYIMKRRMLLYQMKERTDWRFIET